MFLRDLRKARVSAETAYGLTETHMRVGQYLWHTIQDHRGMTEFKEADFHWHASMAPSIVNNLFHNKAEKVDVDVP